VVIAIIAILAALLLPTLVKAKEGALMACCQNNQRQWMVGMRCYIDDSDGYPRDELMGGDVQGDAYLYTPHWYWRLAPYTKAHWPNWTNGVFVPSTPLLGCPAYDRIPNRLYAVYCGGYGYNGEGVSGDFFNLDDESSFQRPGLGLIPLCSSGGDMVSPLNCPSVRDSDVVSPSQMIAMGDALILLGWNWEGKPSPFPNGSFFWGYYDLCVGRAVAAGAWCLAGVPINGLPWAAENMAFYSRRHANRFNAAFCDGHVENLSAGQMFDIRQEAVLQRWNRDHQAHQNLVWPNN
jgi:prepilin-type processing-associated H-X9-DG protein